MDIKRELMECTLFSVGFLALLYLSCMAIYLSY